MKVVRRSLLSLFTMKVLLYEFPIASWNLVMESCVSTTFKPCKEKFYSSNMKVVRRSLLSLFTMNVLLYEFPIASWNPVLESCASTTFKPCKKKFYSSYMKDDLCFHYSLWMFCYMSFQSRAGISWWNHALAQQSNLVKRSFILRIWKL